MRVGITGHQDLAGAEAWCRGAVQDLIRTLPVTYGYTSLAAGADQLFADLLCAERIPFTAIIPCDNYERAFASVAAKDHYARLLAKSSEQISLSFAAPSQEAFLAAGQKVVVYSETLIAVWNGQAAKGLGGTADIVAFAREQGVVVVHCHPNLRIVSRL
jgi:hypothetical protein